MIFDSESNTTVQTTNQSWTDSYNNTLSGTKVISGSGNVALGINVPDFNPASAMQNSNASVTAVAKYLPWIAGALAIAGVWLILNKKAKLPWATS